MNIGNLISTCGFKFDLCRIVSVNTGEILADYYSKYDLLHNGMKNMGVVSWECYINKNKGGVTSFVSIIIEV